MKITKPPIDSLSARDWKKLGEEGQVEVVQWLSANDINYETVTRFELVGETVTIYFIVRAAPGKFDQFAREYEVVA